MLSSCTTFTFQPLKLERGESIAARTAIVNPICAENSKHREFFKVRAKHPNFCLWRFVAQSVVSGVS